MFKQFAFSPAVSMRKLEATAAIGSRGNDRFIDESDE
jgi:hypothetical protein